MDLSCEARQRPKWEIATVLEGLVGQPVRVAAKALNPVRWHGEPCPARSQRPP
jgi:hypothetical protein